jgi:hypothetical protein
MTLFAAFLGVGRLFPQQQLWLILPAAWWSLILGILVWTQWIVLLRPDLTTALPIGVVITLLSWGGAFSAAMVFGQGDDWMMLWTSLVVVHATVLALHLLILRANGYRLVR